MTIDHFHVLRAVVAASLPWPLDGRPRTALEQLGWYDTAEGKRFVTDLVDLGFLEPDGLTSVFILEPAFELLGPVQAGA